MRLRWVMMVLGVVVENRNLWLPKDLPVWANKTMNAARSQAIFKLLMMIKLVFLSGRWWLTYLTWNKRFLDAITWTTLDASVSEGLLCRYVTQPSSFKASQFFQLLVTPTPPTVEANKFVLKCTCVNSAPLDFRIPFIRTRTKTCVFYYCSVESRKSREHTNM